ncbi:MAG TPA: DUF998 domain-containing protein [Anaerolineaceae bacterium]|nr:DUF998 domain-containing protein [Anaerolineaceae bacterium]
MNFITRLILFKVAGLLGCALSVAGALIAGSVYRGKQGEPYSIFNHFISELGERGVSQRAWAFNWGLILCGVLLLPTTLNLGLILPGLWAKIGLIFGVITALSLSLVGVFSMDNLKPHGMAAVTFFRAGLLMVFFFSLAIAFQPQDNQIFPRTLALAGLPAIVAFSSFLVLMGKASKTKEQPLEPLAKARPRVWKMAVSEWSIFVTIVFWFLIAALAI